MVTDRSGRTTTVRRAVRVEEPALAFTRFDYAGALPAGVRSVLLTVATRRSAVLRVGGRAYRIGPRVTRLRIALPARPARVRVPVTVIAGGRRLSGTLIVQRG